MSRFKKFMQKKNEGKIVYGDGIVNGIVLIALADIPNAKLFSISGSTKTNKSIKVYFDKDGVHIDVMVVIDSLQSVSDMSFKIQEIVRHTVESMTEYHVASVNVIVKDVSFDEKSVDKSTQKSKSNNEKNTIKKSNIDFDSKSESKVQPSQEDNSDSNKINIDKESE